MRKRREAEALVLLGILLVADANERDFEQADDRRQHLRGAAARAAHIRGDALPRIRAVAWPKSIIVLVLRLVADGAPTRVVAVLLATALVAAGRLDVAVRIGADPDVF